MPEAEKFTTFGRGNGFPFCTDRVDVDDAFRFLTLGGYSGEGTPDIELSRRNAMKLYWNLYSLEGTAGGVSFNAIAEVEDVILQVESGGENYDPNDEAMTPVSRDCRSNANFSTVNSESASAPPTQDSFASVRIGTFDIVRMFEDGEFIGFGVDSYFARSLGISSDAQDIADISSDVSWRSIVEEEPEGDGGGGTPIDPPTEVEYNITETEINGVHFLSLAVAKNTSFDSANLTATTNSASVVITTPNDDMNTSASLSTMNFWTY